MFPVNEGRIDGKKVIVADSLRETHKPKKILRSSNSSVMAQALGREITAGNRRVRIEPGGDLDNGISTNITLFPEEKVALTDSRFHRLWNTLP
ncbi:hypothetical protein [Methanosphaerula subterraneus]|uniref:hypothetical protein n=1 Tax=Methanosphaerula subterraneus TaxID=3350244 RepID=UPI003F85F1D5